MAELIAQLRNLTETYNLYLRMSTATDEIMIVRYPSVVENLSLKFR